MRSRAAATPAPRPSSQARAGVEKYAASGSVPTSRTPYAKETALISAMVTTTARRSRPCRRKSQTSTSTTTGQTR